MSEIEIEIGIVEQLQESLSNYIKETVNTIKRQLLTASSIGRFGVEYAFSQSIDDCVVDEIIQNLLDEELIVEYVPTELGAPMLCKITWEQPGLT
jgi:hypothetical protein